MLGFLHGGRQFEKGEQRKATLMTVSDYVN